MDEIARIFERERRNKGLTVMDYIQYLRVESGQSIDDLIEALKEARQPRWQLDVFGELGGHWGRGTTPEEALSNAIRRYCISWQTDPEEGPVQPPPLPEQFNWRYNAIDETPRPMSPGDPGGTWYNVRPPEIDWDAVYHEFSGDLSDIVMTLKKAMILSGAINAELMGNVTVMGGLIEDWCYDDAEGSLPGISFCSHPDAELYPQNGPNLAFCDDCEIMFRTDLP